MWLFLAVACFILQAAHSLESFGGTHLNPEEFMTPSGIIQHWGYRSEEYEVLTEDGYYLQVDRIPYGKSGPGNTGPRPVVLVGHGLLCEGRCWITNIPSNSLGFFLADAGYDVWIINFRGTTWSRRHTTLSIEQAQFWNFTFHEMGIYDLPATINFILRKTKQDALYYIGHSQGGTTGLIAFSVMPQLSQKVKLFLALAPAHTFVGGGGLLPVLFGNKELSLISNKVKAFLAKLCSHAVIDWVCLQKIDVYRKDNLNVSRADVYIGIYPDYTSVKTIIHWKQILDSREFKYFDYGSKNQAVYNKTTPPFYKVEDMRVPMAVWSGTKDNIVTEEDVEHLLPRIKHLALYKPVSDWSHLDFIWGLDASELLYPDMLHVMEKYK